MIGDFALDIDKFRLKSIAQLDLLLKKITLEIFTRVVIKTPVDKGHAINNWLPSINFASIYELPGDDPSGSQSIARIEIEAAKVKAGDMIYLVNNVPYIMELETGKSKQAPYGMVRTTAGEFPYLVQKQVYL